MELLVNELSLHGQFQGLGEAEAAVHRLMRMRQTARRFGRDVYCHRAMASVQVTPYKMLPEIVSAFDRDMQRAVMQWLTKGGPFWDVAREHSSDEVLVYGDEDDIATDTALGEAAFCRRLGMDRRVVSVSPSDWERNPLHVSLVDDEGREKISVPNYWQEPDLEADLFDAPMPIASWEELARLFVTDASERRCPNIVFSRTAFNALRSHPFVISAAEQITVLIDILQKLRQSVDHEGNRTTEGHRINQDFFTGDSLFTNSSKTERAEFRQALTFPDPFTPGSTLFCPWHGKVRSSVIRIHFTWPVGPSEPLIVVYVGPKLTKR